MNMLYTKIKFLGILLLLVLSFTGYAQNPTYKAVLVNDVLVDSKTYEFDIYLLRTGLCIRVIRLSDRINL